MGEAGSLDALARGSSQINPISLTGTVLLAATLLAIVLMVLFGQWIGWDWLRGLIYAPVSAFSQELFFRAVLLPVFLRIFKNKILAVLSNSVLFGIWHIGVFWLAPWWAAILVVIVPFLCSIAWAWEVQYDGTIIYVVTVHTLILIITSVYTWG